MLEREIEDYFCWTVEKAGGKTWKFVSPSNRGVSDRIACMPDGSTHFVELKRPKGGKLSVQQQLFAGDMRLLNQNYACLWTKDQVDAWAKTLSRSGC